MDTRSEPDYEFAWDTRKARSNLTKHQVSFDEAKTVFKDPFLITFPDEAHSTQENRYHSIGVSAKEKLLLIVHLEELVSETGVIKIRIISCRKATTSERKIYEER
ncbi:MAG: BrnT family toxin [Anaerolineales bacterium]|nr:BrnT family toxin [Anaerolineales bacterium]